MSSSLSKTTSKLITELFAKLKQNSRLILNAINVNRNLNKIIITVSIGAIGISIAVNYYFRLLSIRKKRILNKSQHLIEMVIRYKYIYF